MHNLWPISIKWLAEVGIYTLEDLKKCNLIQTYTILKEQNPKVNLNLLWAMYGAVHNIDWKSIDAYTKYELKIQISSLNGKSQKKAK